MVTSFRGFSAGPLRLIAILFLLFLCRPANAAGEIVIDIFGPSIPRFPISVFPFQPTEATEETERLAEEAKRILLKDLQIAGFFEIIDSSHALADPFEKGLRGRDIEWDVLRLLGADAVVGGKIAVENERLYWEARVWDQPNEKLLFGRAYRGSTGDLSIMVHRFVDEIVKTYAGIPGIFQTKIAFLSKNSGHKELYTMDADGENIRQVTNDRSITLSPRWSPDGNEMVFISYSGPKSNLHLFDLSKLTRKILSARKNMNGPAAWSPVGKHLAITLTVDGNPELYLMDINGKILKRLTRHPSIDVSPSFSPDGRYIAFVSDRSGDPQIYLLDLESDDEPRRLTFEGKYNSNPAWSPRGDLIAFNAAMDGNYEIFATRPEGGELIQLTDSPADDESPSWSPDGLYLSFSSTRLGTGRIFVMLFNGENPVPITSGPGEQTSPVWSPRLQ